MIKGACESEFSDFGINYLSKISSMVPSFFDFKTRPLNILIFNKEATLKTLKRNSKKLSGWH